MKRFLLGSILSVVWFFIFKFTFSTALPSTKAVDLSSTVNSVDVPDSTSIRLTSRETYPFQKFTQGANDHILFRFKEVYFGCDTKDTKQSNKVQPNSKKTSTVKAKISGSTLRPLGVRFEFNPGQKVKYLNEKELRNMLSDYGFTNLGNKNLFELRRIWLAYSYDQFYWDVHYSSGFPISIVHAYFIMEATYRGLESDLMVKYKNPGGIKYRGIGTPVKAYDDCYDRRGRRIQCDFSSYSTYEEMVRGWSSVLSASRYQRCKSYDNAPDICQCLYSSGYHTANNWGNRATISKEYWTLRASFPRRT